MPMKITVHDMELYNPVPINEMAYRKVQMEAKLIAQTRNIIEWWGFLYYMANYADINNLTNHEKGKLRSLLKELYEDKLVNYPRPKGRELRASTQRTCLVQDRTI